MPTAQLVAMLRARARKSGTQTSRHRGVSLLKQTGRWCVDRTSERERESGFLFVRALSSPPNLSHVSLSLLSLSPSL